jgi:uncharacterized protein YjiS (DUF1127 family)
MSSRSSHLHPASGLLAAPRAPQFGLWWKRLAQFRRAWATRRQLAELDPRLLRDIGLTEGEALREISRAPWDPGPR